MSRLRPSYLFNGRGSIVHDAAIGVLALAMAAAIYYIDTYTSIQGAIAVLYVIVILLGAEIATRQGLLLVAVICAALTALSYLFTHGPDPDLQNFVRFVVSIAALTITTALLLRNSAFRSELLATNAALQDSENRYRSIFERTRVALWERDYTRVREYLMGLKDQGVTDLIAYARKHPDIIDHCIGLTRTVAANDAARELLGASEGEDPTSMRRFIATGDETFLSLMNAIFEGRSFFEGRGNVTTQSGEHKLVLLSVSFPDDPAAFNRVIVGMIDITQRELAQKALQEARAELTRASRVATVGALSASLAHELNQPLGAIVVNSQTLLRWLDRDPPDLAAVRRSAERMIRDSERASEIIQNTRDMLTQKRRQSEWIDLSALVEDTRALMEHDLQRDLVDFEFVRPSELPKIKTVRIEMQQVLINLITNAIQAMRASDATSRKVTVTMSENNAHGVSIAIRDSGPGLADETMSKLFIPFYTTKSSGMGMGLSICRSTLEARGGKLEGFNHPDGGAVFEITMPIEDSHGGD